jgi:hypothetical protein
MRPRISAGGARDEWEAGEEARRVNFGSLEELVEFEGEAGFGLR